MEHIETPEISSVLHSLKVLAAIKENDKVETRKGVYVDRSDSFMQPWYRWIHAENRKTNLAAIEGIFERALNCCDILVKQRTAMKQTEEKKDPLLLVANKQLIQRLQAELKSALKGVRNLAVTYHSDSHSTATIALVQDTVTDRVERINFQLELHP